MPPGTAAPSPCPTRSCRSTQYKTHGDQQDATHTRDVINTGTSGVHQRTRVRRSRLPGEAGAASARCGGSGGATALAETRALNTPPSCKGCAERAPQRGEDDALSSSQMDVSPVGAAPASGEALEELPLFDPSTGAALASAPRA